MSEDSNEPVEQSPDEVFATAVFFETALAVAAIGLGWALGPSAREFLPEISEDQIQPIVAGLWQGLVAAVPVFLFVELIRRIPWEPIQELEKLSDDQMIGSLMKLRPSELIVISLCAGVGEELLFRGWFMGWIREGWSELDLSLDPAILALVVSSVIFGFFHPITKMYVFLAALMGLYFGFLLLWTENLLVPIIAHAAYDAAQLLLTRREIRLKKKEQAVEV